MNERILNVDDDEAGRYVLGRVLRGAGFEVIDATRGTEALELAQSVRPDLVLLDVNLPDISGHEVCERLRRDPEFTALPILMISASMITGDDRVRGLTLGADAYMTEPVESGELIAVVNALLRTRRAERNVADLNRALQAKVQELETILETLPIGLAIASGPECSVIRGNAAMTSMLNAKVDGNIDHGVTDTPYKVIKDGHELQSHELPMQRAGRGEVVRADECVIQRADGTSIFLDGHASPLKDADGNIVGAVGAFIDVTERKAEDARQRLFSDMTSLLAEALDVEKTIEGTARIVVRHLADWCVIDLVQSTGKLRRAAVAHRDEALEAEAREISAFHPDAESSPAIFSALESGRPVLVTELAEVERIALGRGPDFARALKALGMSSFVSAPLLAHGRSVGVLTVVRASGPSYTDADVKAVMELASRAALAIDNARLFTEAEEANRAKDVFFAVVSHELRTPLTSIMGWATMLTRMTIDPETLKVGLNEIHRSAKAQTRIVEDLLDAARISAGKIHLQIERVSLEDVVDEALSLVQPTISEKEIDLRRLHEPAAVVSGDRQRLVQIASNLMTNAVKFTPEGGRIDVTLRIDDGAGTATLSVQDNGRGISPEFLPSVFDRFAQQDDSTGGMGLGLGLNIVKSFVEMHGGHVSVCSEGTGLGCEFVVTLPLAKAARRDVGQALQ